MATSKNTEISIETASPHTIKKFELIEKYVETWAQKLLNFPKCNGIVFIDCMCNSGIYNDDVGNEIIGTPIRVANYLAEVMKKYPSKKAWLLFNDLEEKKIEILKTRLPANTGNFNITTKIGDGNTLLKDISIKNKLHYLLVYDPYQATISWEALLPFFSSWSEVIINHMVFDSVRGISQAKRDTTIAKYEQTYLASIEELVTFGNNRSAYEKRIQEIIKELRGSTSKPYYIASFPFFNRTNALVYNLLHCSGNIKGFKLFKETAWKTFGDKSSSKTASASMQLILGSDDNACDDLKTEKDENCYFVKDILEYLHEKYKECSGIPLDDVWNDLDEHPIFPTEGYKNEIKKGLKDAYGYKISGQTLISGRVQS